MELNQNLTEELKKYKGVLESEYNVATTGTSEDLAEVHRTKLYDLLDSCYSALNEIILGGESESARISAIKMVYAFTLGEPKAATRDNDVSKLILGLRSNDPVKPNSSTSG